MANIYYYPYGFIFSDKKLSNFALENYDEITILNKYYFKYDVNTVFRKLKLNHFAI